MVAHAALSIDCLVWRWGLWNERKVSLINIARKELELLGACICRVIFTDNETSKKWNINIHLPYFIQRRKKRKIDLHNVTVDIR